ncbi:MAG: response regulator [Bacteroidia bacterium]|nr:response regulator [Bacteroidia bacterium]
MTAIRILIVEDDPLQSLKIAKSLREMGYEVAGQAMTADEAIFFLERELPDLALIDINLTGQAGNTRGIALAGQNSPTIPSAFHLRDSPGR